MSKANDLQPPNSLDTSDDDLVNSKNKPYHHRPNLFIRCLSNRNIGLSLFIIPLTIANALYINSNEPCPCNEFDALACVFRFVLYNLDKWMTNIFIAALIFATFILLPIFWKYKTLKFMSLATIVNVVYLAGFHDNKITVLTYGQAFGMLLALYMILIFLSFGILCLIFKALRRRPIITLFTLVVIISTSSYAFYYGKYENSCAQWAKGLGGDEIDNSVGCKINLPETCVLDMLEGVIDLSFWDCKSSLYKADPKLIEQYYPKAPIIGLPRIEYAPVEQRVYLYIQNYIFQNSVGLESFDDPKAKNLEIFIDQRDKEDVKFVIDVKRNESLVQQRAKLQDNNAVSNNVLVIFIDSISRARMFKKLTKTIAWLEKLYNQKNPDKESFQFFKFHGITPYTMHNVLAANFGYVPPENKPAPLIKATSFVSEFHKKGYITARTSDHCDIAQTLSGPRLAHVEDIPFDHEGMPFACDPHHHIPESPYGLFTGAYSMRRKCLYGEDTFQTTLEYGDQFWRAYPGEKKLLWMDFLDAHEATQESVKYLDDPLTSFLENLDRDKLLEDTMIIFWSDHGNHMPFPPYSLIPSHTNQERALPMLFLVLPSRALPAYRQNLKENSQKLVTAYQIYHLLVTIPNGQEYFRKDLGLLGKVPELGCTSNKVHDQACFCLYGK